MNGVYDNASQIDFNYFFFTAIAIFSVLSRLLILDWRVLAISCIIVGLFLRRTYTIYGISRLLKSLGKLRLSKVFTTTNREKEREREAEIRKVCSLQRDLMALFLVVAARDRRRAAPRRYGMSRRRQIVSIIAEESASFLETRRISAFLRKDSRFLRACLRASTGAVFCSLLHRRGCFILPRPLRTSISPREEKTRRRTPQHLVYLECETSQYFTSSARFQQVASNSRICGLYFTAIPC